MSQAKAIFTYFSGRGLGEGIRLALSEYGVKFDEVFIETKEEFNEVKASGKLLWNQLPLLEIDGLCLVQSMAIQRYLARKFNTYGDTNEERTQADMIADGLRDCLSLCTGAAFRDDGMEAAKKTIEERIVLKHVPQLEKIILAANSGNSGYSMGPKFMYPDILGFEVLEYVEEMMPGRLQQQSQVVHDYWQRIRNRERISAFLNSNKRHGVPWEGDYVQKIKRILY